MANSVTKVIQWNVNGFFMRLEEIKLLIRSYEPNVLVLQETHTLPSHNISLRGFNCYRKDHVQNSKACGGVCVFVKNFLTPLPLTINTHLQAVAVRLKCLHLTVCSIYLPPNVTVTNAELEDLIVQLPPPFLLLGDINAHNPLWGSEFFSPRGRTVECLINSNAISLVNNGDPTYFSLAHGTFSSIDLSLASTSIATRLTWSPHDDLCSSDHFPLVLTYYIRTPVFRTHSRWLIDRANWHLFERLSFIKIVSDSDNSLVKLDKLCKLIIKAAEVSIPRSKTTQKRSSVPWWSKSIERAIKERKRALRVFKNSPSCANLSAFRRARACAKFLIKEGKRRSWENYVSSISYLTPSKKVWEKIRRIQGTNLSFLRPISHNNTVLTNPYEIANAFADHFSSVSSSANHDAKFVEIKNSSERNVLDFCSASLEAYNKPFSMWEFEFALGKTKKTSPGSDNIHNLMLKNLNSHTKSLLLSVMNEIWEGDLFPSIWRRAILIPIPKASHDLRLVKSYRPISMTSCICKLFERIVYKRLYWIFENENLITNFQCGFRQRRSCLDHQVRLESYLQSAFLNKEHAIGVFFDLEKAYDTTWRYLILRKLHEWGIRGHMAFFVKNFLADRTFQVRIGNTLSGIRLQENGIPQGSVLSCLLFAVAINDVSRIIKAPTQHSLFVDDLNIYLKSKSVDFLRNKLQNIINNVNNWAQDNGFRISKDKTFCIHFCRLRGDHNIHNLFLNGEPIPFRTSSKFLGLVFDNKLNWKEHISQLKIRCLKTINILKVLSHSCWGADPLSVLRVYRALIRSRLDYGSPVYSSARESILRKLDVIHNMGIRIAIGAFRTSPVLSLQAEAAEPPLRVRREILSMTYILKIKTLPTHPSFKAIFNLSTSAKFSKYPGSTKPLSVRLMNSVDPIKSLMNQMTAFINFPEPPWLLYKPKFIWDLAKYAKSSTNNYIFNKIFGEIRNRFPHYDFVYTDGSKSGNRVGCAFKMGSKEGCYRLSSISSIYTAELKALELALIKLIREGAAYAIVVSDSRSALSSLQHLYSSHPLVQRIQVLYRNFIINGGDAYFMWVPSHCNILGNEEVDCLAKKGASKSSFDFIEVFYDDLRNYTKKKSLDRWKGDWEHLKNNKLREIKPHIIPSNKILMSRKEHMILVRLRIGHCLFSHGHLISRRDPLWCAPCDRPYTVRHVLIDCPHFGPARTKFGLENKSLGAILFDEECMEGLFCFLKFIDFYHMV